MPRELIILITGVIAIAILLLLVSLYMFKLAIRRNRKEFLRTDPNMPEYSAQVWQEAVSWYQSQPFEDIELRSSDGLLLRAHFLSAETPTAKTVILAHGYSGQGEDMSTFARVYQEWGYHVLLPDNRGHGHSEGEFIGFGWPDRKDYLQWISYVIDRIGEQAEIVLHGISMGGGTVLMVSGEPLPPQVKCIVSDCAYTSVKGILTYQLRQMFRLPPFPLLPITSLICKLQAGYFFGEASAVKQVSQAKKPILFIHGDRDTFVPTPMLDELYAAAPVEKEKLLVHGAQHGLAYNTEPDTYNKIVLGFINRYVN